MSTNGRRGVGCPSRSDFKVRKPSKSSLGNRPASAQAAYSKGAACPLERTNRSLLGALGFFGSYRITEKNKVATISAAEQQLDGWPLPASLVARTLLIRSSVALLCNAVRMSGEAVGLAIGTPFEILEYGWMRLALSVCPYRYSGEEIEANKSEGGESMNQAADEGGARMRVRRCRKDNQC